MVSFGELLKSMQEKLAAVKSGGGSGKEEEIDVIEIDGIEYWEMKQFPLDGTIYVYLCALKNPMIARIHKLVVRDGEEYLARLDDEEEFDRALLQFEKIMLEDLESEKRDAL